MSHLWQQEAERMGGQPLVALLTEMRDNQLDMRADVEQLSQKVGCLQAGNERLLSGFPADDVDGHRRYHQSVIERRELVNKMLRETLVAIAKTGT
ncbi:MAG: hypothetical protein WCC39_02225, partial [Telluria sp.]